MIDSVKLQFSYSEPCILRCTDNPYLIAACQKNYHRFLVPTGSVHSVKLQRRYTNSDKCDLDIKTCQNLIGEIVNLSQELNTKFWDGYNSGADFDQTVEYAKSIALNICHWFTVDDLVYLKRGGRVSPTVALVGKVLGIKPVLHVDNEGKLISMSKVRGRKAALSALADKYGELAKSEYSDTVFISNADCMDDVKELESMLKSRYNVNVKLVADIGTVIGAHSGPGTIALFFVAKER